MRDTFAKMIQGGINDAATVYHRLVFISGGGTRYASDAASDFANANGLPSINVNLALGERLLDLPVRQRAFRLPQELGEILDATAANVVLLNHIELLFIPELSQDPLRLFQGLSRNRTLLIAWPAVVESGHLIYAEPGHPEFHRYQLGDAVIVTEGSTTN